MIRVLGTSYVKDCEFAQLNLVVSIAEKLLGTEVVKAELDRHKIHYYETLDAADPRDS